MTTERTLLRDVIDIPERVHHGALVFQLADATADPAETARTYVVTDQLKSAFIDAVSLIRSAVTDNSSMAAYLHGSFGSGKSNFMGVLQLLLDGATAARAIPQLADVVADIDRWRGERRFLTVPFHLIGEHDLESAVLGQYVSYVGQRHPDAPLPAVFADEPLLKNADELRANVDDEPFFGRLSEGAADDNGWGTLSEAWTAATYDAARTAPHGSPERIRLVQALISTWLSGFADAARANRSGYVNFADGLSAISHHAKILGYDGVILFLDELILWFLSRLGDLNWVNAEGSKLSKLVEAATASRPVPIVSIIARQRDLRDLVGDDVPGAERLGFVDQLDFQAGRFDTITLDDSNLPLVANRRLLTPVDADAAATLRQAFESLSLSSTVRETLLTEHGDDASFRLTYPFSPAFMTVLVDVAGALQRTRTGLRVLLELLVARRDDLEVGQLVPVGDLYDVIAETDDPFSDVMRSAFDQARKLYTTRFRPALLSDHGLSERDDPTTAFGNDDRLVKTLLLAALVPQSLPFKDLTVARLVALNHGLISSPIPGQETTIVVGKLRRWASQIGELRLGTDPNNPSVHVVLSDVDTGAILATAAAADNTANRRTLMRRLVLEALGLPDVLVTATTYPTVWRGLRRDIAIHFGNIRDTTELPDSLFVNDSLAWQVVVDFPFDEPGHSPTEDLERLDRFVQNGKSWSTLCWLPAFFTADTLDTLGRLVRLNHVLANNDRFAGATVNLSPLTRAAARPVLQAMQMAARAEIDAALLGAYGVTAADERVVDRGHTLSQHFPSLRAGLTIQPPTRPSMREAFDQVLDQALRFSFPGAPDFASEVKLAEVRKVAELATRAVGAADGRLLVDDSADRRLLTRVANPLSLGMQSEQAFTLQRRAEHWDGAFIRAIGQARHDGASTVTVSVLRDAINHPHAAGLTRQLENLIILVWAQATSHTFREHGGPAAASVDRLEDSWEVVEQPLPDEAVWHEAQRRLGSIFGITLPTTQLSGFAVERAGIELADAVARYRVDAADLVERIGDWSAAFGVTGSTSRAHTAALAKELLDAVASGGDDLGRVDELVAADVGAAPLTLGKSIAMSSELVAGLDSAPRAIILAASARPAGAALRQEVAEALGNDELVTPLLPVLRSVGERAVELLGADRDDPVPAVSTPPGPADAGRQRWTGSDIGTAIGQLETLRTRLASTSAETADVSITIEWTDSDEAR